MLQNFHKTLNNTNENILILLKNASMEPFGQPVSFSVYKYAYYLDEYI